MKKGFSRVLAYLMVFMMIFTMVPAMPAYAVTEPASEPAAAEQTENDLTLPEGENIEGSETEDEIIEEEESAQTEEPETTVVEESSVQEETPVTEAAKQTAQPSEEELPAVTEKAAVTKAVTPNAAASTTHSHTLCGSSCDCTSSKHPVKTWTAWNGTGTIPTGYCYLTADVELSSTKIVNTGSATYLCLNGHSITCDSTVFDIYSTSLLTITDCAGTGKIDSTEDGPTIGNNKYLCVWEGTITNSGGSDVIYAYPGSTTYINGGTVHASGYGAAITSYDNTNISPSELKISGGTLDADGSSDVVYAESGDFIMTGGHVKGHVNVYDEEGKTTVSGGTIDGRLNTYSATTAIAGGSMNLHTYGDVTISAGKFHDDTYLWSGNNTITGGDFTASPTLWLGGETWISGGSYSDVRVQSSPLYLSGVPEIGTLGIQYANKVSAQNPDGTGSYGGDPIDVWFWDNSGSALIEDGDIAIKNVKTDAVAEKFVLTGQSAIDYYLEHVDNNLVAHAIPHGKWYSNVTWSIVDGTLTIEGEGEITHAYSGPSYPWGKYSDVITNVVIGSGITKIPTYTFEYMKNLESITFPDTLEKMDCYAFTYCVKLNNLLIPASLTYIAPNASMNHVDALTDIYYLGTEEDWNKIENASTLDNTLEGVELTKHFLEFHEDSATCTEKGVQAYYAFEEDSVYEYYFDADMNQITELAETPAKGHNYDEGTVTKEPGLAETGTKTYVCQNCGNEEYEDVPALEYVEGELGNNLSWKLDAEGNLCISGTGSMNDYTATQMPWYEYSSVIKNVQIEEGVTTICNYAFEGLNNLINVTLPTTLTSIGSSAFAYCGKLTDITIPVAVTSISGNAFTGCKALKAFVVEDGNTVYKAVDGMLLYSADGKNLIAAPGACGSVVIPEGTINIPDYAFAGCEEITDVIIPETVTEIRGGTFEGCTGLTNVIVPKSVTRIGSYAFSYDTLVSIIILNEECELPAAAIEKIEGLKICGYAGSTAETYAAGFGGFVFVEINEDTCPHPERYNIAMKPVEPTCTANGAEEGVECSICGKVLVAQTIIPALDHSYGDWITEVEPTCTNAGSDYRVCTMCGATDSRTVDQLGHEYGDWTVTKIATATQEGEEIRYCYCGAYEIKHTDIDTNVIAGGVEGGVGNYVTTWILDTSGTLTFSGNGAIPYCYDNEMWRVYTNQIKRLVINEGITAIGGQAFEECTALTGELEIPETVTSIGSYAFEGCTGITGDLIIPDSVTNIGYYAFQNCTGLKGELKLSENLTTIDDGAFRNCTGLTGKLVLPDGIKFIDRYAFEGCTGFTGELTLPPSLTTIEEYAFSRCIGFTGNLKFYDNITYVGESAFEGCSGFNGSLELPDKLLTINSNAFGGCSGFTGELIIPKSVTSIGSYAFGGCSGFTGDLVLDSKLTDLNYSAFSGCTGLENIYIGDGVKGTGFTDKYMHPFGGCTEATFYIFPDSVADQYFKETDEEEKIVYLGEKIAEPEQPDYFCFKTAEISVAAGDIVGLADLIITNIDYETSYLDVTFSDDLMAMYYEGEIAALSSGDCTVTVKHGNMTASALLHVREDYAAVTGIVFDDSTLNLEKGITAFNQPVVFPLNASREAFTWKSSNSNVVTVNDKGLVTAVGTGTAVITATADNGVTGSYEVRVDIPIEDIVIVGAGDTINLVKGTHTRLDYFVYPSYATNADKIQFINNNTDVVTIDAKGNIKAVGTGTAEITVTNGTISKTVTVIVTNPLKGIQLEKDIATIVKTNSEKLNLILDPVDADNVETPVWTSSDEKLATVDDGVVTVHGTGLVNISVTVNGFTDSCRIICAPLPMEGLEFEDSDIELEYNETMTLVAKKLPEATDDKNAVTWKSSDENIVSVDDEGNITATGLGTAIVTAAAGKFTAECTVTVIKATPEFDIPEGISVNIGKTLADIELPKGFVWADETQDVGARGQKTFKAVYTPEDTNHYEIISDIEIPVYVRDPQIISISLPENMQACVDAELKLEAEVQTQDDPEYTIEWTVENGSLASIDENGVIKGLVAGTTTVTATIGGVYTATSTLSIAEHQWEEDYTVDKEATCVEEGSKSIHCAVCDITKEGTVESIPMIEHAVVVDKAVEPTCYAVGLTEGSHCDSCKEVFVAQEEIPMVDHQYSEWYIAKEPTETEDGIDQRDCDNCDAYETRTIEKLGNIVASGRCGEDATWTINEEGLLRIRGTGAITDDSSFKEKAYWCVQIDEGITAIGDNMFQKSSMMSLKPLPSTLESIGKYAFNYCWSWHDPLILPDNITEIGEYAFAWSGVSSVVLPATLKTISGGMFAGASIESVVIPEGVTTIGPMAFDSCPHLVNDVVIPKSVTKIDYDAFRGGMMKYMVVLNPDCVLGFGNLSSTLVGVAGSTAQALAGSWNNFMFLCDYYGNDHEYGGWQIYEPAVVGAAGSERNTCINCGYYESRKIAVVDSGACGEDATWTVDYEGTLTVSGTGTITDNSGFKDFDINKVIIEEGIAAIGNEIFRMSSMQSLAPLPSTLETIGDYAFVGCNLGAELVLPENLTAIGKYAFSSTMCSSVELPASLKVISEGAFSDSMVSYLTIPEGVTTIGDKAFSGTSLLGEVIIPESVTAIGAEAFANVRYAECFVILNPDCEIDEFSCMDNTVVGYEDSTAQRYAEGTCYFKTYCEHYGHDYPDEWIPVKESTCSEQGYNEKYCSHKNCTVTEKDYLPLKDHDLSEVVVEPTCQNQGYSGSVCNRCDFMMVDYIPTTDHKYGEMYEVSAPTCEDWGVWKRDCMYAGCNAYESGNIEPLGHEYGEMYEASAPTCEGWGCWKRDCLHEGCSAYESGNIDPLGHTYGEWIIDRDATCTTTGSKHRVCKECGMEGIGIIPVADHAIENVPAKDATCTEKGNMEYWHCTVCDTYFDAENFIITEDQVFWPATGHTPGSKATCTTNQICTVCEEVLTPKLGHKYSTSYTVDKKATTSAAGSKSKHCTRSGCKVKSSVTAIPKISTVTLSTVKYTYSGSAKTPTVTVKDANGKTLVKNTDYSVSYPTARTKPGVYKVTVKFKGSYSGEKPMTYSIVPKAPSSASAALSTASDGYDDIKFSWKASTGASGYLVYYKKGSGSWSKAVATKSTSYTKKELAGGAKYTFKVVPYYLYGSTKYYNTAQYKIASTYTLKKLGTPKVTKSGSKVKVSWTNISGETGYQISQSTSKSKTKIVATYKTTSGKSKVISAAKGKTYYYKVRAYKTVGTKKVYGPWSTVKSYKRK